MDQRPVSQIIDELIEAPKVLGGEPGWQPTDHNQNELRLLMPLLLRGGTSTNARVEVKSYPNIIPIKYRILFLVHECLFRVDYAFDETHLNPLNKPYSLLETRVSGLHYHSWNDNKTFCTHTCLPRELKHARILPDGLRNFDNTFRWFCGQLNIEQPSAGLVELPPRTRLL